MKIGLIDVDAVNNGKPKFAMNDEPRYITLLRAAHTLLKKQHDASYVLNLLAETVDYDEAECDGACLLNDIEYYFDEIGVEIPESEKINP